MNQGQKKKLGKFKGGGKNVLPEGDYKLRTMDFTVKTGAAGPFVVVDCMVVGPKGNLHTVDEAGNKVLIEMETLFGQHTDLGFSMAAEGVAKVWLTTLGLDDDVEVPIEVEEEIERFLKEYCRGALFLAHVSKGKDIKTGKYDQNSIEKPWENLMPATPSKDDYVHQGEEGPF